VEALALLDSHPIDLEKNKKAKAELMYLRGKAMDFLPEYTKQAEENLSKSIKLMPSKTEAWDALAHVYWKKQDVEQAKKCFEGSLDQDADNKIALRNLSMVYRMLKTTNGGEALDLEERKKNFKESIDLAKKAIALDMKDSQSWYVLGNAHLTNFFQNYESTKELDNALRAYAQSEKNMTEANPDMFYNRATILEYLERYNEAVNDYQKAS
jgi:tetratricopeptide (TPR) repeat protein